MDLKEAILSTLAELEKDIKKEEPENREQKEDTNKELPKQQPQIQNSQQIIENYKKNQHELQAGVQKEIEAIEVNETEVQKQRENGLNPVENELRFLTSLRERVLVLFEGLQSPNNRNIEAKVDLILNFLEYLLAVIDERIESLSNSGY